MRQRYGFIMGLIVLSLASVATAQGDRQQDLGPGLYVFQTRTRSATCADDERTGYVSTFVAPIHGVPGSRAMRMQLLNTEYWPTWQIQVTREGHIVGDARLAGARGADAPANHFEVTRSRDRFTGTGHRTYRAGGRECRVDYDALLRRIDML